MLRSPINQRPGSVEPNKSLQVVSNTLSTSTNALSFLLQKKIRPFALSIKQFSSTSAFIGAAFWGFRFL